MKRSLFSRPLFSHGLLSHGLLSLSLGILALGAAPPAAAVSAAPPPGRILSSNLGLIGFNADASNLINYTPDGPSGASYPSVSRDGKLITFMSGRDDPHQQTYHIYVMNSDGTGTRQLTFPGTLSLGNNTSQPYTDYNPVISPDGTKVAFVSVRDTYTLPSGYIAAFSNAWVINTDGTNLHRVTQTQPNLYGNGVFGSDIGSVVWGPDSRTIAFRGLRLVYTNNQPGFSLAVGTVQDDGSGYKFLDTYSSTGESQSLDWSPNGRYLAYTLGGEAQGAPPIRLRLYDLSAGSFTELFQNNPNGSVVIPENGGAGALRFSPDSTRLLSHEGYGVASYFYNLDGSNVVKLNYDSARGAALWWEQGPAIPKPDHLSVSPNPVFVPVGGTVHLLPTLYDAQNNVIVHAVRAWNLSDDRFFSVSILGDVTGTTTAQYGTLGITPDNGGVTALFTSVVIGRPKFLVSPDPDPAVTQRSSDQIYLSVTVHNRGDGSVTSLRLNSALLNGVAATSGLSNPYYTSGGGPLPFYAIGTIGPGSSQVLQFRFPASVGAAGTRAVLRLSGDYAVGTLSSTLRVTLP